MIFCHCHNYFIEFFQRNRLVLMIEFEELLFVFTFRTLKGIITKGYRKELCFIGICWMRREMKSNMGTVIST